MAGVYRPRHPERTVLYRVLFRCFDQFPAEDESRFEPVPAPDEGRGTRGFHGKNLTSVRLARDVLFQIDFNQGFGEVLNRARMRRQGQFSATPKKIKVPPSFAPKRFRRIRSGGPEGLEADREHDQKDDRD
jgi:hypothetical protein